MFQLVAMLSPIVASSGPGGDEGALRVARQMLENE